MLSKPKIVSSTEVERIGGLRRLSKKERKQLSNKLGIKEEEITNRPLVQVYAVSERETTKDLPNFADVVDVLFNESPNKHLSGFLKEYFTNPPKEAPIQKGIINWEKQSTIFQETKKIELAVYYVYYL